MAAAVLELVQVASAVSVESAGRELESVVSVELAASEELADRGPALVALADRELDLAELEESESGPARE